MPSTLWLIFSQTSLWCKRIYILKPYFPTVCKISITVLFTDTLWCNHTAVFIEYKQATMSWRNSRYVLIKITVTFFWWPWQNADRGSFWKRKSWTDLFATPPWSTSLCSSQSTQQANGLQQENKSKKKGKVQALQLSMKKHGHQNKCVMEESGKKDWSLVEKPLYLGTLVPFLRD